jgi:isoleucyl-tRNA synthetase
MFTAIGTAFSGILSKVLLAGVVGMGGLALWQYTKANSLDKDLIQVKNSLKTVSDKYDTLKKDYANLEDQLKKAQASKQVDEIIRTENEKTTIVYKDRFDMVDKKVNEKVRAIQEKYAQLEQNTTNIEARDREVSAERIGGLWNSFCVNNPSHARCATASTAKPTIIE